MIRKYKDIIYEYEDKIYPRMTTTISIDKKVFDKLKEVKLHKGINYSRLINDMLNELYTFDSDKNKSLVINPTQIFLALATTTSHSYFMSVI